MPEIVYKNWEFHLTHAEVEYEVWEYFYFGSVISDACAQTIASYWHSPGSPNSTALSTMGAVTDDMCLSDFASALEFANAKEGDKQELTALQAYILDRQKVRN